MDRVLLRVPQAAEVLNLSVGKTWALVASGELRSIRIGGSRRIPVDAIEEFVRSKEAEARPIAVGA